MPIENAVTSERGAAAKSTASSTEEVRLTLIDGPTLLIEMGGLRILTDPTFDEPQTYTSPIVITKFHAPPVTAESLLPIDAVLLSHDQHRDNLDIAGRAFLAKVGRVFSTVAAEGRMGSGTRGLAPWSSVELPLEDGRVLTITGTPGRHGPAGFERINGDVTGFVLSIGDGPGVYVSGDTVWYAGGGGGGPAVPDRAGGAVHRVGAAEGAVQRDDEYKRRD